MQSTSDIVQNAQKEGIVIPAFNIPYLPMVEPVIRAVVDQDSFALIATARLEWTKFESQGPAAVMQEFSKWSKPGYASMHLDHIPVIDEDNLKVDYLPIIQEAISLGYQSVMVDGSRLDLEGNIRATREVVKLAHQAGISCEAELGAVLGHEAGPLPPYEELFQSGRGFTDIKEAGRFVQETGCDWLSVAIGSIHGAVSGVLKDKKKVEARINLEHLENLEKARLHRCVLNASGMRLSGLAGLYCYFMGLSHAWMADNAIAGWLIPSEFMDVNYGETIKQYLLRGVTLLRIHRFDPNDVQFADALVSSAVVWFRNASPPREHSVTFSFGGSLLNPRISRSVPAEALLREPKWTRFPDADMRTGQVVPTVSEFFQIKRGIATGCNDFFILEANEVAALGLPREAFHPILPSPRYLPEDEIDAEDDGNPIIERRLLLLDTRIPEDEMKNRFPTLWRYLETGKANGIHERYLCRHRSPWYAQDKRAPAPIICTYMGRGDGRNGSPFRFIRNRSCATVANVYLAMYPTRFLEGSLKRDPALIDRIWKVLNAITPEQLIGEGRVYGGGLHKLEPKELANVSALAIAGLLPEFRQRPPVKQLALFGDELGVFPR